MASGLKERAMVSIVDAVAQGPLAPMLVLRGGLVVRRLIAPTRRPVDDVDFLGLCSPDEARGMLRELSGSRAGEATFTVTPAEVIWEETEFPGLRAHCDVAFPEGEERVQIDIGFGDPRAVADTRLRLEGMNADIAAVGAETTLAWKTHGVFERGDGGWRAKDLIDILDLHPRLTDEDLAARALQLAFDSRGDDFTICERFLRGEWGMSRGSRRKWRRFRRDRALFDPGRNFPEDFQEVVASLRQCLTPLMEAAMDIDAG